MAQPPSQKRRLVVGGGRAGPTQEYDPELGITVEVAGFPRLKRGDISLNVRGDALPHVQGDINRAPFQNAAFDEIYFEKVPYQSFTGKNIGALNEAARLLKPGCRLIIETGRMAPLGELRVAMRTAGFCFIRMTDKGFLRITARRGGT